MNKEIYIPDNIQCIEDSWIITDNTTLTDASITFELLANGNLPEDRSKILNWYAFLDLAILNEVILVDNRVMEFNPRIQWLLSNIGDFIKGIEQNDPARASLKQKAKNAAQPFKDLLKDLAENLDIKIRRKNKEGRQERILNGIYSGLHRIFFYTELSNTFNLPFSPSINREKIITYLEPNFLQDISSEEIVKKHMYKKVLESINQYKNNIKNLSGLEMPKAEIPPIALLVAQEAKKAGSWSEAIYNLRNSKPAKSFRMWLVEIVGAIKEADGRGIEMLRRTNCFIEGWSDNIDENVFHKKREVQIKGLPQYIDAGISLNVKDPIINKPQDLIFLHNIFKANITPISENSIYGIPLS